MKKNKKKGFTIIEMIVTIAILAIASAFIATSYSNIMVEKRLESDQRKLAEIDDALKQILIREECFDEVKNVVYGENQTTLELTFYIEQEDNELNVDFDKTTINGSITKMKEQLPTMYDYLIEYVESITLDSSSLKAGTYVVYVEFNGTQVSEVRDFVINNDSFQIKNSGLENISE